MDILRLLEGGSQLKIYGSYNAQRLDVSVRQKGWLQTESLNVGRDNGLSAAKRIQIGTQTCCFPYSD